MVLEEKVGLVLGGGGAKGSYEIGVWKALRKLEIEPKVITGSSVGALNAALILQGDYKKAENMWKEMTTEHVLNLEAPLDIDNFKSYQKTVGELAMKAVKKGGISSQPLEEKVKSYFQDESVVRSAGIDMGITLTKVPNGEVHEIFLDDIPEGQLADYLMASASFFPAMAMKEIEGKKYADGGYFNNIPIGMARKKGATKIIAVDIKAPGKIKNVPALPDDQLYWIRSNWSLGNMLIFDKNRADINIDLGYYETMKKFDYYIGSWYTFEKAGFKDHYQKFYRTVAKLFYEEESPSLKQFLNDKASQQVIYSQLCKRWNGRIKKQEMTFCIQELTGKLFKVDPCIPYSFETFNREVLKRYEEIRMETNQQDFFHLYAPNLVFSAEEWYQLYKEQIPWISQSSLTLYFLDILENDHQSMIGDWKIQFLMRQKPVPFVMALYVHILKKEFDK